MIAQETSCENLDRMLASDLEDLAEEEASPGYLPEGHEDRLNERVAQIEARMDELDCD